MTVIYRLGCFHVCGIERRRDGDGIERRRQAASCFEREDEIGNCDTELELTDFKFTTQEKLIER